ncbi:MULTISPECIES: DUF6216 family protein [Burkholderiaceae]|uniref:DUF6216 family protein n=1 Tax=Burkholderiaceae TaxID=119060 RepID=UPI0011159E44|nr:DUF6216 family protein [Burkholderia sp. b13]MCG1017232.1 hypothetical protein [Mycetohabitans sp. B4]
MESLSTFVQSPALSPLSIIFGGLIMVGLFWWRAGSIHIVLDRLWRLVAGKADVHDPVLKALLLESRDIEKFKYTYRLKVETMAAIHRLDKWRRTHEISMSRLQKMRFWIDTTSHEMVRQPPRHYVLIHLAWACLALFPISGISQLVGSGDAYLQTRTSKVLFKTDAVTVKAPLGGWSFDSAKCVADKAGLAQLTGFNASEIDAICNALKDDSLKALVKQTLKEQAWVAIAVVLVAVVVALSNILAARAAKEALRLRKQLYPSSKGDGKEEGQAVQPGSPKSKSSRFKSRMKAVPDGVDVAHPSEPHGQ